jgi:Sec-independent protein translocase protein TatA
MALDPLELITIGGIVVVILIWGPSKIPEFAKMFGQAKKEFDVAQKQFQQITKEFQTTAGLTSATSSTGGTSLLERFTSLASQPQQPPQPATALPNLSAPAPSPATTGSVPQAQAATPNPAADSRSADQVLIDTARELGIATEGKTRDEIAKEIVGKAKSAAPTS